MGLVASSVLSGLRSTRIEHGAMRKDDGFSDATVQNTLRLSVLVTTQFNSTGSRLKFGINEAKNGR